jgi:hypothetical protein
MNVTPAKKAPSTGKAKTERRRERDDQSRATGEGMKEPPRKAATHP